MRSDPTGVAEACAKYGHTWAILNHDETNNTREARCARCRLERTFPAAQLPTTSELEDRHRQGYP